MSNGNLLERKYQRKIIRKLKSIFSGCVIMKTDPGYIQGFPDLLVLYKDKWAALELKRSANAPHRPNQEYYIDLLDEMSYASFLYPENEEEVFYELQRTFEV